MSKSSCRSDTLGRLSGMVHGATRKVAQLRLGLNNLGQRWKCEIKQ